MAEITKRYVLKIISPVYVSGAVDELVFSHNKKEVESYDYVDAVRLQSLLIKQEKFSILTEAV